MGGQEGAEVLESGDGEARELLNGQAAASSGCAAGARERNVTARVSAGGLEDGRDVSRRTGWF